MSKNRPRHSKPVFPEPAKTELTDDDVSRIDGATFALAKRGNGFALGLSKMMNGKPLAEKRRMIAGTYLMAFEFLAAINLATESEAEPMEVLTALRGAAGVSANG